MPDVLELAAGIPARPGGDLRVLAGLGLDAGLLIDADQHGAGRRVQVQAAHGPGPGPECGVVGAVEPAADLVRADLGLGQDPAHGGGRDRQAPPGQVTGNHGMRPLRLAVGRERGGDGQHRQAGAGPVHLWPPGPGLIEQAGDAADGEPALPGPRRRRAAAQLAGDRGVRRSARGQQDDPGPQDQPLRARRRPHDLLQLAAPLGGQPDRHGTGACCHHGSPSASR